MLCLSNPPVLLVAFAIVFVCAYVGGELLSGLSEDEVGATSVASTGRGGGVLCPAL